jgi:hypothetical protein
MSMLLRFMRLLSFKKSVSTMQAAMTEFWTE